MTESLTAESSFAFNGTKDLSLLKIELTIATDEDLKRFCETKTQIYASEDAFDYELYELFHYDFKTGHLSNLSDADCG
ncbi:hypothetical protein GcM1_210042 [Golovinomyces cichoracearum]|uniref:Uncharacterized protein n=1 Tax=Golovinomyces cichoracearum TaxID=62708 RepID=A0A420IVN1_9PEZI|nr:hypothetical protein GcM1_210042 [Golovinomyces cichoracearum]